MPDSLAPFDADIVSEVADANGFDAARLRELLADQQRYVRRLRGADGLAFEYRKAFAGDTVAERTDAAYYLAVPASVWAEYGETLGCSPTETTALRAVHDRQFRRSVGRPPAEGLVALVLTRE